MQPKFQAFGKQAMWQFHGHMDVARRAQGAGFDALGWGPAPTPSRVVLRRPGLTLRAYGDATGNSPTVLMVPAPIKRAYIWDLAPGASVVADCLARGMRPYLIHWEEPDPASGLADYADRLIRQCLDAIEAETGERRAFLVGHSLGGLFAAIFAVLYWTRVRGLALLNAPLHFEFGNAAGVLGPVMAELENSGVLRETEGNLPGSLLSLASYMAAPEAFGRDRGTDWLHSLGDPEAISTHLRVERWSLDELPLARQLMADLVHQLYAEDGFLRGTLALAGRRVSTRQLAAPLLMVGDRRCAVVPPAAILPAYEAADSAEKRLLWYEGDVGVAIQHVGVLVGRNAHRQIWPEIFDWMRRH